MQWTMVGELRVGWNDEVRLLALFKVEQQLSLNSSPNRRHCEGTSHYCSTITHGLALVLCVGNDVELILTEPCRSIRKPGALTPA